MASHVLQPSAGDRVYEGSVDRAFPASGTVVPTVLPWQPRGPCFCNPASWGFPQSFALSGSEARRQCGMKDTVHTYGDCNSVYINQAMWRPIHKYFTVP